jgi:hypothetical protein
MTKARSDAGDLNHPPAPMQTVPVSATGGYPRVYRSNTTQVANHRSTVFTVRYPQMRRLWSHGPLAADRLG